MSLPPPTAPAGACAQPSSDATGPGGHDIRIPGIDALRGFALFGICMVNAPVIAGAWDLGSDTHGGLADHVVVWLVTALCTSKFYLLFSFLFGYSFTLQMQAADRDGASFARRHGRRLLGLFLIGLAHAVLLYPGDILMTYAALGLVLFCVRGMKERTALRAAALLVALLAAVFLVSGVLTLGLDDTGQASADATGLLDGADYRGGPSSVLHANVTMYGQALAGAILYSGHLFAALLAGCVAGRRELLKPSAGSSLPALALRRRVLTLGLCIGLPGGVLTAMCTYGPLDERFYYLGQAVDILTSPALAAAYGCGLLALLHSPFGRRLCRVLAPAGRMSLSNYLFQSLVLAFLFTGYGCRLYGTVGPAALVCICAALYAAQLCFSSWLMARTRYGPAELLLRSITLGRKALGIARTASPSG